MGQIRLGPPEKFRARFHQGFAKVRQGCTKVPPKLLKFRGAHQGSSKGGPRSHQSSPSFVVSWAAERVRRRFHQSFTKRFHQGSTKVGQVSWCLSSSGASVLGSFLGKIRLGLPKGSVLKGSVEGPPRFHQGFTEVPPKFHQRRASVVILLGQIRFGVPKVLWKVPPSLLQFLIFFFAFFPALALGSSGIGKVLGQNDTFVFWGLQQMAFASQKVLWSVPQTVLDIGPRASCGFLCKWQLLQRRFRGGYRQLFFTFVSQMVVAKNSLEGTANRALHLSPSLLLGSKLRKLLTCLTHTNPVRRKRPIMSLLLVFLGFIFSQGDQWRIPRNPSYVKQALQKTVKSKLRKGICDTSFPFPYDTL